MNFQIIVHDTESNTDHKVTEMDLPIIERTKIILDKKNISVDGKSYSVTGWIACSSTAYSNEEMAGVRIYASWKN